MLDKYKLDDVTFTIPDIDDHIVTVQVGDRGPVRMIWSAGDTVGDAGRRAISAIRPNRFITIGLVVGIIAIIIAGVTR